MTPQQLKALLTASIAARLPVLVTGAPGAGKSDIVAQAAAAAAADLLISHPVVSDPTDAKGLPWKKEGEDTATFLPFGDLAQALASTEPLVWFVDDLGQAAPAVQAAYMQLILARRVNGHALPDCVTFVAATNRRTDRAGVSGILEPVKSRFATIVELVPDLDQWCSWALDNGIAAEIVAFVRFRPELFNNFEPSADLSNCPLPRTWSHVSRLMDLDLDADVLAPAICGAVGEGAGAEFIAFLRLWSDLPDIDGILSGKVPPVIPTQPGTLYAVCTALSRRVDVDNFANVAAYAMRLVEAGNGEFAVLLVRDCEQKTPAICNTEAYVRLATGPLGKLITGGE